MEQNARRDRHADLKTMWFQLDALASAAESEGNTRQAERYRIRRERVADLFFAENEGLIMDVAKMFFRSGRGADNSEDYRAAAKFGLWEAFLMWDPDKSTLGNFSRTYIKGRVMRAVKDMEADGVSYGDFGARAKVRSAEQRLSDKLGRAPTADEIASDTGHTKNLVDRVRIPRPSSLDAPVGDGDATLGDLTTADEPSDDDNGDDGLASQLAAAGYDLNDVMSRMRLGDLSPVELFVFGRKLGLDGASEQTLNSIGDISGLGRETVRRHSERAVEKVKAALAETDAA